MPGEECGSKHSDTVKGNTEKDSNHPALFQEAAVPVQNHVSSTSRAEPRTFYLSKTPPLDSLHLKFTHDGIQKRTRKPRKGLAVFMERSSLASRAVFAQRSLPHLGDSSSPALREQQSSHLGHTDKLQKRPNATETEKRWRMENWDKCSRSQRTNIMNVDHTMFNSNDNDEHQKSLDLAAELKDFALQETAVDKISPHDSYIKANPTSLKFQPKSPPPRYNERNAELAQPTSGLTLKTALGQSIDNQESDYVYDTYIRRINPSHIDFSQDPSLTDPLQHLCGPEFGLLVITEEDEDAWEAYGYDEDDMSDRDWNSEEEDENG